MTKEALEKEADEYATEDDICVCGDDYWSYNDIKQAYLAGAEPREKRIEELEEKIKSLEGNSSLHEGILWNDIHNQDKKIAELEAQIEKMKCCFNCKHSRTEYEHCRTDKHEKWEMIEK